MMKSVVAFDYWDVKREIPQSFDVSAITLKNAPMNVVTARIDDLAEENRHLPGPAM